MTIIGPLPFTLTNGTTADASQVQADLDQIRNDVNNNAAGGGGSGNVIGPASAIDGHLAVFDGITGKILKDGGAPGGGSSYRGAVAILSSDVVVTSAAFRKISFSGTGRDTDSIFNISNPTRLNVPAGVTLVRLSASIITNSGVSTNSELDLVLLATGVPASSTILANNVLGRGTRSNSGGAQAVFVSPPITVAAGNYFEVQWAFNASDTITLKGANTWFEMQILG